MNKFYSILLFILLTACAACPEKRKPSPLDSQPASSIAPSVDRVETYRVDESLIRIIEHNLEVGPVETTPLLEIERFKTPEVKLAEVIRVNNIKVGKKTFDFQDTAGVFIETLDLNDDTIVFTVEFFYRRSGGSEMIKCKVSSNNNKLGPLNCRIIHKP